MNVILRILVLAVLFIQLGFTNEIKNQAYQAYTKGERLFKAKKYEKALVELHKSYTLEKDGKVANDIGIIYKALDKHDLAIKWYKLAYKKECSDGAKNLGSLYEFKHNYSKAIEWFIKSYQLDNSGGAYNLGNLYTRLKDYANAIKWYEKAILKGHIPAIKNLSHLYRTVKKDTLYGAVYMIALIDKKYSKKKVLKYLRGKLKINEKIIQEAYELQKSLVPNPYMGGIN